VGSPVQIFCLSLALFISFLGIGATIPPLPLHLRKVLGLNDFGSGAMIAILGFCALLTRFPAGNLADTRGRRITTMIGFLCCGVSGLFYAWTIVPAMAAARVFHGLGEAFLFTSAAPWITEMAGPKHRGQALGFLSAAVWGGLAAGPIVASLAGTFAHIAWIISIGGVLSAALVAGIPKDQPNPTKEKFPIRWKEILLPGSVLGLTNVAFGVLAAFMPLYVASRGGGATQAFTGCCLAILFGRVLFGSFPDRWGPRPTLLIGLLIMIAGMLMLTYSTNQWMNVAACTVLGLGYSFPWPAIAIIVMNRAPERERASAVGILGAYYDIYVAMGAFFAGLIAQHFGLFPVVWFATGALAIGLVASLWTGLGKPDVDDDDSTALAEPLS
jgi:MFS family permease